MGTNGFFHGLFIVITGVLLMFLAPWTMRAVVLVDRALMRALLSPDPMTARVRTLEQARAQTVDASAATLRQIERDLHDGTQAQLVALAMRLGQAKEKLAEGGELELDSVRRLVDDAHRGAKEAIVELRDLARGIHPPVLDTGLEGALSTLAARSTVPADPQGDPRGPSHTCDRDHRLFLRGRASRERRAARPRIGGEHQLCPARAMAACGRP
ncbi:MAG: histidine kinase, partial [Acidimicrobiales bacterium]